MKKVFALVMAAAILFSTMEVGLKVISKDLDPYQITFFRFLIGGIFLLPFAIRALKKKGMKIEKKDILYYIFLGSLNGVLTMSIFQLGVQHTKASIAAVLFCINPMFTILLAHFMTHEKLNKRKIIALIMSVIGILIIINPSNITGEIKGMLLVLTAAFGFGLYSVCGIKQVRKYGGITHTSISFLLGSAVLFILLLIFKKPIIDGINISNILPLLYIGVAVSGVGYLAYFSAMEMASANIAALTFFIKPVIAPFIAVFTLNEKIEINTIVGIIFIVGGSFVTLKLEQYFVTLIKIKKGE